MGVEDLPSDAPQPRLCHLVKRPDFSGYGFNLHAEKAKPGQYIGTVDPDSPADLAGLKEGDRIVEVNGVNINQENHKQVVERIKSVDNSTRLLVVDKATEEVYKRFSVVVKGTLPTVHAMTSEKKKDDVIDFKEQQAAPPPLPETPPPDEEEQNLHSRRPEDSHSIETPSNDQGATEGLGEGQADSEPLPPPPHKYEEEVQLTKNEIVVEVTIESSEEDSETKSVAEDPKDRRESNGSVQSGSTASFKYAGAMPATPECDAHPADTSSVQSSPTSPIYAVPDKRDADSAKVETSFADQFIDAVPEETSETTASPNVPEVTIQKPEKEDAGEAKCEATSEAAEAKSEPSESEEKTQEIKPEVKPIPFDRSVSPISSEKSTTVSESGSASPHRDSRSFSPTSAVSSSDEPHTVKDLDQSDGGHGNVSRVNSTGSNWGGLNLNMTAKEMREMIGSKKKRDPRRDDRIDFHKKYEIIQTL